MDKSIDLVYNNLWIVYCSEKATKLSRIETRFNISFLSVIREIKKGDFLVINSPSNKYLGQKCFLVLIEDYPIIVPFEIRNQVLQLITLFPDRRYKYV